jgi:hypothetical protein
MAGRPTPLALLLRTPSQSGKIHPIQVRLFLILIDSLMTIFLWLFSQKCGEKEMWQGLFGY